jgi:hypothetical protein
VGRTSIGAAAAALRMDGMAWREIADYLSVSQARAKREVEQYLEAVADTADPRDRRTLRAREDARLDALLHTVWKKALDPADPEQLSAARTALAISERRARLHGLDAPAEMVVRTPASEEIDAWVARVAGAAADHGVQEAPVLLAIEPPAASA